MSDHAKIYLQPECCANPDLGRLWCQDDAPETCPDGESWTPYVLASEYDRLQSEVERLRGRLTECHQSIDAYVRDNERLQGLLDETDQATPWLLRKQAEAVEVISKEYKCGMEAEDMVSALKEYAQRLRQQAAEGSDETETPR